MKIGRNIPKTYMDRHFDTARLFKHSRPWTPKVVLPKKKESKPRAMEIDISSSLRNINLRFRKNEDSVTGTQKKGTVSH